MIKESVKSASTIEDAKAAALLELGLTEDDVYNIEVLQKDIRYFRRKACRGKGLG